MLIKRWFVIFTKKTIMIVFAWLLFAFIVAIIAAERRIGFWAALILSLIFSPVIGLIITVISPSLKDERYKASLLAIQREQQESISKIGTTKSVAEEITRFAELKNQGLITDDEFQLQKRKLLESN